MAQAQFQTTKRRILEQTPSVPADTDVPPELHDDELATLFWTQHAAGLARAGVLSIHDRPSFLLLCQTWSRLQTEYSKDLAAMFIQLSKNFAMTPAARKAMAVSFTADTDSEFNF